MGKGLVIMSEKKRETNKLPLNCELCKYHLEDDDFIEEHGTKHVCGFDDDINPGLIGFGCDEFKLSKWALVEYLQKLEETLRDFFTVFDKKHGSNYRQKLGERK